MTTQTEPVDDRPNAQMTALARPLTEADREALADSYYEKDDQTGNES